MFKYIIIILSLFFLNNCFEAKAETSTEWKQLAGGCSRFIDKELGVACYKIQAYGGYHVSCVKLPGAD